MGERHASKHLHYLMFGLLRSARVRNCVKMLMAEPPKNQARPLYSCTPAVPLWALILLLVHRQMAAEQHRNSVPYQMARLDCLNYVITFGPMA